MTFILTSKRRAAGNRAPAWPFTVNWDSPQAQGIVHWYPMSFGDPLNPVDMVRGDNMSPVGTAANISRQDDAAFNSPVVDVSASSANWGVNTSLSWADLGWPLTMGGWFLNGASSGDQYICSVSRSNTNARYAVIIQNGGTDSIEARTQAGGTEQGPASSGIWPQDEWHHGIGTYTAAKYVIYMDGIARGEDTTVDGNISTSTTRRNIGSRHTTASGDPGRYFDIRFYAREQSPGAVWDMYSPATRFDLWYALGRKTIFIPVVAAAAGGNLLLSHPPEMHGGFMQ